jgi:hypothetical protein
MKKLISIFVLLTAASILSLHAQAQVIVIVNPGVAASSISKAELHKIFADGASSLKDGSHVVPVLLRQGPVHADFLTNYVGTSPVGLLIVWRGLVMSGQGTMPKLFDSEPEVVEYVAHHSNAIGYIGKATPHDGVKVLAVQ